MKHHLSLTTALLVSSPALAQDFLSIPPVVTASPESFTTLFAHARFGPGVNAVMLGDSQEACPTGAGAQYLHAFNGAWANHYGVTPRTPLTQPGATYLQPNNDWLLWVRMLSPAVTTPPPETAPDALPGLANWLLPAAQGQQRGWAMVLQPRVPATDIVPTDGTRFWIDVSQGVYIDVFGFRQSGEITARFSVVPANSPASGGFPLFSQNTTLASAPSTGSVARSRLGPVSWSAVIANGYTIQTELIGADAANPSRLVSASFVSVANDVGLCASDISAGGYTAASLVANHLAALPQLEGLAIDAVFIAYGANDLWRPPDEFKGNLTTLIRSIREKTSPNLPVIIFTDPAHANTTPTADSYSEMFPRMAAELAVELPAVCAINSRRLTHEQGWTLANVSQFTTDGIHYNATGALLKANLEVNTLWSQFVCPADVGGQGASVGGDGELDNNDLIVFVSAFFDGRPFADMGHQGGLPGADGIFDNNDFIAFITAFFAGCP